MRKEASKSLITIGHNYNETTEGRACIYPRHHMVCLDTWEERGKPGEKRVRDQIISLEEEILKLNILPTDNFTPCDFLYVKGSLLSQKVIFFN